MEHPDQVVGIRGKTNILHEVRGGKRCERCERCSCKDFPTGVKFRVKNIIKGGVKNFSPKLYSKNVIKGGVKTP